MSKKYNIIYADPPWSFKTYSEKGKEKKSADMHYGCMTIEDIYNLDVNSIADTDCALFLWVTFPLLQEGLKTIEKWGFTYKTCAFNWVKYNKKSDSPFIGLGYWTRSNSEICLLATKGHPHRISKGVRQVIETCEKENNLDDFHTELCTERLMKHSKKPDSIRDRIVELCGDVPRIELFARNEAEGWTVLGNEINGKDIRDEIEMLKK